MRLAAPLVLASTSIYRRQLLERLGIPFEVASPATDETPLPNETPEALVRRLAEAKARSVAGRHPGAVVIASDQVAVIDGQIIGKPGSAEKNAEQLRLASNRAVTFYNGLALRSPVEPCLQLELVLFRVHFRPLSESTIQRYIERDRAFDCAGGFKSEQLGIALFSSMEGEDPTALMGLPLIALTGMLDRIGMPVV
ncbi:MAG: Maf family nucleotide pyrophosphatase [Magnetococcus sp. YQC-9]